MSNKNIMTKLLLRRDTSQNLINVIPFLGEPVFSTDTKKLKIGDGSTTWANLPTINQDTNGCVVDVDVYVTRNASGSQPPDSGWVYDQYISGTKQAPWVWTKTVYSCQNGETIDLYSRVYDSSWIEYDFVGQEETVTTQFPCSVSGATLSIGVAGDPNGVVTTTGTFTPSGTIEVK